MKTNSIKHEVLVVGGGHAGSEAALAAARMGAETLLITQSRETIAQMSCNPAIGGIGKGHLVKEIDALGGEMGKAADASGIQFRVLNASRGAATRGSRCQSDHLAYKNVMRQKLEKQPRLLIFEGTADEILMQGDQVIGLRTDENEEYLAETPRGRTFRRLLDVAGKRIGTFSVDGSPGTTVLIYRWRSERMASFWNSL